MPLNIPNTVAVDPNQRLRQVAPAVGASYCRTMANDVVDRIAQYEDLDLRPLVSTAQVPLPSKPINAIPVLPGIPDTGDPSASDEAPPLIMFGF
jgi:hypothetical protein